jgi:hypothetical protein
MSPWRSWLKRVSGAQVAKRFLDGTGAGDLVPLFQQEDRMAGVDARRKPLRAAGQSPAFLAAQTSGAAGRFRRVA